MIQNEAAVLPSIRAWINLSRAPFHLVGGLPFILGNVLAWQTHHSFEWLTAALGCLAVVFIMLATYYSGEYFDYEVDLLSARLERNRFSGGTQVLQSGAVDRKSAFFASLVSLGFAGCLGIVIQFVLGTGPLTLLFGLFGMTAGFFYTTKPVQWSYRGVGEVIIGVCYGWLPIAAAYYLQAGSFSALVTWVSLPVGFSIFNVILINEFPDYPADLRAGKRNLVVRFGREKMAYLYSLASIAGWVTAGFAAVVIFRPMALLFLAPILFISGMATVHVLRRAYRDRKTLEKICALTLLVNLGTTLFFIVGIMTNL